MRIVKVFNHDTNQYEYFCEHHNITQSQYDQLRRVHEMNGGGQKWYKHMAEYILTRKKPAGKKPAGKEPAGKEPAGADRKCEIFFGHGGSMKKLIEELLNTKSIVGNTPNRKISIIYKEDFCILRLNNTDIKKKQDFEIRIFYGIQKKFLSLYNLDGTRKADIDRNNVGESYEYNEERYRKERLLNADFILPIYRAKTVSSARETTAPEPEPEPETETEPNPPKTVFDSKKHLPSTNIKKFLKYIFGNGTIVHITNNGDEFWFVRHFPSQQNLRKAQKMVLLPTKDPYLVQNHCLTDFVYLYTKQLEKAKWSKRTLYEELKESLGQSEKPKIHVSFSSRTKLTALLMLRYIFNFLPEEHEYIILNELHEIPLFDPSNRAKLMKRKFFKEIRFKPGLTEKQNQEVVNTYKVKYKDEHTGEIVLESHDRIINKKSGSFSLKCDSFTPYWTSNHFLESIVVDFEDS